ncbi:MAG: hypothetical protein QOG82_796 [Actinomycetota bacterium]|nr:hypothetical protein [Actinomycetota bacterium]
MRKKRLMSSLAVAAGLGIGGLAGVVLGVPGVSAAQTTTTTPAAGDPGTTTAPATPDAPADRPPHDENCPNMGGESGGTGSSTSGAAADAAAAGFHRGPRGGVVTTSL